MKTISFLFSKSLLGYLWEEFRVRYRFKFVLPRLQELTVDGVRLDAGPLPLKARNRILHGAYERAEKQACLDFLTKNDSVVELGSAIGFIGLFCRKQIGIERFVSFEANPRTVEILKRNYALNGAQPAIWNLAIGPEEGSVELHVESDFWENTIVPRAKGTAGRKTMEVPAVPFASIFQWLPWPANVLIVDIEGAEQYLAADKIPEAIDKIIIELHPQILGPARMHALIAELIGAGFYVARDAEGTFVFLRKKKSAPARTASGGALEFASPALAAESGPAWAAEQVA